MSAEQWLVVSGLALAAITAAGVLTSILFAVRTLREVQRDRRLARMPHLAFEPGAYVVDVEFVRAGRRIPGVEPDAVEDSFPWVPADAESVRQAEPGLYGELRNYGTGPALSTIATWIPSRVEIGTDWFPIDDAKLAEPLYGRPFNTMPMVPSHIMPGASSALPRLPTFIEKDIDKKVTAVEGLLEVTCEDVFGEAHKIRQEFLVSTEYAAAPPAIVATFGDVLGG